MRNEYNCKLTISRVHPSHAEDYIEICLRDDKSFVEFVTAKVSMEEFAKAVTGISFQPCTVEIGGIEFIGKRHENKTIQVKPGELAKWLKANPGWFARESDATNHHMRDYKTNTYTVNVWHYVEDDNG